jgi:hypothetical protein
MTEKFTFKNKAFGFILMLLGLVASFSSSAQSYCTSWSYYGCFYSTTYYAPIERLRIKDISNTYILDKQADGCNSGITTAVNTVGNGYSLMSTKPSFTLASGSKYTIESSTSYGSATASSAVTVYLYVWIDLNRDGNFSTNEYMSTGWSSMIAGLINKGGNLATNTFTVPCGISAGTSRMRVLASYSYVMDAAQGCKQGISTTPTYYYGETEDYTITLANPTSIAAGFYMPNTAYVGTLVNLTNNNQIGYIGHQWDIDDNGSNEYTTINASHIFNTTGTKCIRLKSQNCLGRDSVLKCINVVNPTAKPVVDFAVVANEIERYGTANFIDLSTNGPVYWSWYMYDPKDSAASRIDVESYNTTLVGSNPRVHANPAVFFNRPGTYNVCLQTSNSVGPSSVKCKPNYLRVTPPKDNPMGAGTVQPIYEQFGNIMDDGGRTGNYSHNRIDYATIIPCGAKTITLTFSQFKVAAGDELKIYDGVNAGGIPLHPGSGFTLNNTPKAPVVATSGAMYLYFSTNGAVNDSGFIASWATERGPTVAPVADFVIPDTLYNPVEYTYTNTSKNVLGNTQWIWSLEPGYGEIAYTQNLDYAIYTDNDYDVTLEATTCMGYDKYTKKITVVTPHEKASLDFLADNRRPNTGEVVTITAMSGIAGKALKADRIIWNFFPNTVSYVGGTGPTDSEIKVTFNAKGKYAVSMRGWNSLDSAATNNSIIKSDYVIVVEHCTPLLGVSSSTDIAINNVKIIDSKNVTLLNNSSFNNLLGYDDYTNTVQAPKLTFGATYTISLSRLTNVNPMTRKVWIDWNIDGDFDDAGELVATENTATTLSYSANFMVPSISSSFTGKTKMRIGTSYSTDPNLPCGASSGVNNANRLGEFEDYRLEIINDNVAPVLTLNNNDTLYLEIGTTYTEYSATAIDATEGDISSKVTISSDLDMGFTGIYYNVYDVTDAGGNKAIPVTRVIYVVKDRQNPVLTLNGSDTVLIEVFGSYTEDGASAMDNKDGNLTNAIIITGTVNTSLLGTYKINYSIKDESGNESSKNRIVIVRDTQKPTINNADADVNNEIKVQIVSVFIDRTKVIDNYDVPSLVITAGPLGLVDTRFKGSYKVYYDATDGSGNKAVQKAYTYVVDDYVGPTIVLNTLDTVVHPVNTIYAPVQASVFDNYYDNSQVSLTTNSNVIFYKLGLYYDEFKATDGSGNITIRRRYIRVVDNIAPIVNGYPLNVGLWSVFDPSEGLTITDNYDAPSALRPRLKVLYNNLNTYVEGVYAVTYSLTDFSGNVSLPFNRIINVNKNYPTITSGINDIVKDKAIQVYPNPSTGLINISYNFATPETMDVKVYNATGALVSSLNSIHGQSGIQTIDLSNEASGLYHVRMMVAGKQINRTISLTK